MLRPAIVVVCLAPALAGCCLCTTPPVWVPSARSGYVLVPGYVAVPIGAAAPVPPEPAREIRRMRPRGVKSSVRSPAAAANSPVREQSSPIFGTPEWERQEAEDRRQQQLLNRSLRSICHGC